MGEDMHGSRKELLWSDRHGKEAQTSGGNQRAGAPSRWTVTTQQGQRKGGKNRVQRDIEEV